MVADIGHLAHKTHCRTMPRFVALCWPIYSDSASCPISATIVDRHIPKTLSTNIKNFN